MKPAGTDKVHVIVTEKPNKVWVVVNDTIHSARWRTADISFSNVVGNVGLLNAVMLAWLGEESFSLTFAELEERSQGWGAWSE